MHISATSVSRVAMVAAASVLLAGAAEAATLTFGNATGGPIPPSGTAGLTSSTVSVAGVTNVTDVMVTVEGVSHNLTMDLEIYLTGPTGVNVDLVFDRGGIQGAVDATWTFSDAGVPGFSGFPASGTYMPQQALSAFDGLDPNGVWTLFINDDATGDVGRYRGWTLTLRTDDGAAAVPLPATLPLAVAGLGLLGLVGRRRRGTDA